MNQLTKSDESHLLRSFRNDKNIGIFVAKVHFRDEKYIFAAASAGKPAYAGFVFFAATLWKSNSENKTEKNREEHCRSVWHPQRGRSEVRARPGTRPLRSAPRLPPLHAWLAKLARFAIFVAKFRKFLAGSFSSVCMEADFWKWIFLLLLHFGKIPKQFGRNLAEV